MKKLIAYMSACAVVPAVLLSCHKKGAAAPTVLCIVTQKAYSAGWKTCGDIIVYSDGTYLWDKAALSGEPPETWRYTGRLAPDVLRRLTRSVAASSQWQKVGATNVTVRFMDDWRAVPPPGVDEIIAFLRQQHPDG